MTRLARTRWLFVISRGTAFRFRGPSHEARTISRKLGVRYVLQGSADFTGKRIRVRAALIDAVANCEAWAGKFDCDLDDVFRIQEEIANEIVSAVETEIEQSERRRALMAHPSSLDAWSAYHRGAWHMYQFTPEGYEEAGRMLRLAAKLDPNSARAFAGLSFVHWQRAFLKIGNDREGEIQQAFDYAAIRCCSIHASRRDIGPSGEPVFCGRMSTRRSRRSGARSNSTRISPSVIIRWRSHGC